MKNLMFSATRSHLIAWNGIFIFCVSVWTSAYALPTGEFPVSSQSNSQYRPDVASSGETYLVVWQHNSGGATGTDIWGKIIEKDGDTLPIFPICEANLNQWLPRVAWGEAVQRYLVTWRELENKMFGQFVDINGTLIDTAFVIEEGLIMTGERGNDVASNGDNFIVVWSDSISGASWDIHGRIVTGVGSFAGPSFTISDAVDSQLFPVALGVGKNYLVAWVDSRTGNQDPYGQRISPTGSLIGSNFAITPNSERQRRLALAANDTCILVVWEEDKGFLIAWELYGSILDTSCTSYIASDFKVAGALNDQRLPSAAWHSDSSKFIVGWHDYRGGGKSNIYITKVTPSGSVGGEQKITNLDGAEQWKCELACSDVCFLIVWEDERNGSSNVDIYGYLPDWCPVFVEESPFDLWRVKGFKIMPNPFEECVRFIGVERVRIYDSSGRLVSIVNDVWDGKNQKGEELPAGTYFVQSTGNSGRAHKIIKLR